MSDLEDMMDEILGDDFDDVLEAQLTKSLRTLKQRRDELRVQLNLAAKEIRDDWEAAEERLGHFVDDVRAAAKEGQDAWQDVRSAGQLLAEELGDAYRRIASRLQDD